MPQTPFPYYPINDFGPLMPGLVIGGLGIFHVFLAQFAIGGGWLMCYFQRLAQTGAEPHARRFLDGYFRVLVLISFVLGALTGVAMWFTTIQLSARTIGMMIDEFHWIWATEWLFFFVEVISGYAFYRYARVLSDRVRFRLLLMYSIAAWGSLFWINGILSWQLTPGRWLQTHTVFAGFFNPSFWPSLLYRTAASLAIAALVSMIVINTMNDLSRPAKRALINRAAWLLAPVALMPFLGAWYLWSMPAQNRQWSMGGSVAMTMFLTLAIGATILVGGYAIVGLIRQRLYINGATATLLAALAFGATAGGEFVREGSRKPYTIRDTLYSNSLTQHDLDRVRVRGIATDDPYPLRNGSAIPTAQLRLGATVYRDGCSICHTLNGTNGLAELLGTWTTEQKRYNISHLQHTKSFMPPFPGNAEELEALVSYLEWVVAGRPGDWPDRSDPSQIARNREMLDHAGTAPQIGEYVPAGSESAATRATGEAP